MTKQELVQSLEVKRVDAHAYIDSLFSGIIADVESLPDDSSEVIIDLQNQLAAAVGKLSQIASIVNS